MDKVSTIFLASSLVIIMLGMGLSLTTDDFKRILVQPKAILIGLMNQIILLPLIGFGLVWAFNAKPEIAIGIMILAACPGGPTSNLISNLAKGDIALSVSLTALSSLITIITIPYIVNLALVMFLSEGQMIQLNVLETIMQIMIITVIPVSIGMIIRRYRNKFAERMAKPVKIASGVVIAMVIIGLVIKEREDFVSYFQQAGILAFLLNAISMLVGLLTAKLFNVTRKRAVSISIESGIQNGTMAITIAVVLLNNADFAIGPAVYSLIMFATGGIAIYFALRKKRTAMAAS